ncbi:LytR/AlgR family response regulator transcription factor [Maribacter algicola]|uniref:LytR/AlgR family response regulator transcription factor n=1 Tax=Meishania litoralis TaxID=3434685 RepID=A0ACC7LKA6_9FLAO
MNFKQFLQQDFPYLDSTRNKLILIGAIGLYSSFFLIVYSPFNIDQWKNDAYWKYVLLGILVIFVTQFVLRPLFGIKTFNYRSLIFWCLFELFLMATALHVIFAAPHVTLSEKIFDYLNTLWIVTLIAAIPYFMVLVYLVLRERLSAQKEIENKILKNSSNTAEKLLTITGENEKIKLAIKYNQLLLVKSAGNYLELFYLQGESVKKELVRSSLKEFEEKTIDTGIIKAHRSYLVNINHIASLKKTKKSYELIVQHLPDTTIPVSTSYKDSFEKILKRKSPRSSQHRVVS